MTRCYKGSQEGGRDRAEATRDGAPPVDLVSGEDLCDLLRDYGMGVTTREEPVHEVDESFFDQF
jgi:restriction system protein